MERRVGVAQGDRVHCAARADQRRRMVGPVDTLTFIPATTAPSRSQSREKLAVVTVAP
jgi:hypothetical protein